MATYESSNSTAWASSSSVVVTKPTGLAVGDLMVGIVANNHASSNDFTTPGGWTAYANSTISIDGTTEGRLAVFYKVADSGDVAASNFTFSCASSTRIAGGVLRVSSYGIFDQTAVTNQLNNNTTLSATGVTPIRANELYLIIVIGGANSGNDPTYSGYSFATSNPSWTELFELSDSTVTATLVCAYANRPEVTATGTVSITVGNTPDANSDHIVRVISIAPAITATSTPSPVSSATYVHQALNAAQSEVSLLTSTTSTVTQSEWTNTDKPSEPTWTNTNK
jgi:hypothetical protein